MKTSLHIRIRNKVSGLLVILMPFFFCATAMASPLSHKADDGCLNLADTTVSTISSVASTRKQNVIHPAIYINSYVSSSQYTINNILNRNLKSTFSIGNALAEPPTITCPGDIISNTDPGDCEASVSGLAATIEDKDNDITTLTWTMVMEGATIASSPISGINNISGTFIFPGGSTTVTYRVTDATGLTAVCSFKVVVNDKELPTILCPPNANITIPSCATVSGSVRFFPQEIKDNCGIDNFSSSPLLPAQFPLGSTDITWTTVDQSGNIATCVQKVSVTTAPPIAGTIIKQTNVSCVGTATGSVNVEGSGGMPPYQYNINGGTFQADGIFSNLAVGTYNIIIKDINNCTFDFPVIITQPATDLTASISDHTNVLCAPKATGSATATASGGTSPYTYSWNTTPVQTTATATNLIAGTFTVTVTDAAGCIKTADITITQPAELIVTTSKTDVLCFGETTGTATALASGGTPPYAYAWFTTPIQITATIADLPAGTYPVAVFDSLGCFKPAFVDIIQPATKFTASITSLKNVLCAGNNTGLITVAGSGGKSPYQYNINGGTFQADGTFNNLTAGAYTIIAKDANDCQVIIPATITEPATPLTVLITSQTNVLPCAGQATGSATVTASGGILPYTYSWNTTPEQTTATATSLIAGTFTVTVTDAAGCIKTADITITQPAELIVTTSKTDVLCFGEATGTATALASGGTPPYAYAWRTTPIQITATIADLPAGTYPVDVIDAANCPKQKTVIIIQPASKLIASFTQVNLACAGSNTGSITVTASGGVAPIEYSKNGGAFQASSTFSSLAAGSYAIIARDANSCTVNLAVTITEPATALTASISDHTNVLCAPQATGSATVTASGGILPYAYSWNTTPEQTTATATSLIAGTFTVTVTDAAGCIKTADITITQPAELIVTTSQTDVLCFGEATGTATALASGGTPPYMYAWLTTPIQTTATIADLPAGTYPVAVIDAAGCPNRKIVFITEPITKLSASITNQENVLCASSTTGSITIDGSGGTSPYQYNINGGAFQAGGTFNNLTAGKYTIIVKDANNCEFEVPSIITSPPDGITASITSQTNVPCAGETNGSATVMASGGTAPYTYSWNTTPVQTTTSITNLAAGTYIVTSTDNAGCFVLDTAVITEPLKLTASITNQVDFDCVTATNGSVTVEGADGASGYQYSLDGGAYQAGGSFIDLAPGNYAVTVQDANNCKVDVPVEIKISGLIQAADDPITTSEDTPANANVMDNDQILCNLPIVVTANTNPQHGTVIMNSNGTFMYTPSLNYNGADSFTYTITDNVGSPSTATVSIQVDAVNDPPLAMNDYDTTNYKTDVTIIILNNDSDIENGILTVSVCDPPINGILVTNGDGSITYTPNSDFSGTDEFCYTICDDGIPSLCDTAMVYIHVLPKPRVEDIFVYNGFSPNGDGNNDHLVIRGIEDFPDNDIEFFNRNGSKIKKLSHYDNHNVFWDGTNKNGEQLPDGTYFYVLKIGEATPLTGWIFIRGKK